MTESMKTTVYMVAATVVAIGVGVVWYTNRPTQTGPGPEIEGEPLFPEFTEATQLSRLNIVSYEGETGETDKFRVAKLNGKWVLPNQSKYPADAEDQISKVANNLMEMETLSEVDDLPSKFETYGLIAPDSNELKGGEKGVAVRIQAEDESGNDLADILVGKPVSGSEGQHYVRRPGQNQIYTAKIDMSVFVSDFKAWIETNLLQLDLIDLDRVTVFEYATGFDQRGFVDERSRLTILNRAGRPILESLELKDGLFWRKARLTSDEKLDDAKIVRLVRSLNTLNIVDAERKPTELAKSLQDGETFRNTDATRAALASTGYAIVTVPEWRGFYLAGVPELRANNGELLVYMKPGYHYVLRFGGMAPTKGGESLNRYLFITARVTDEDFPVPAPPQLPTVPAPAKEGEEDNSELRLQIESQRANLIKEYKRDIDNIVAERKKAEAKVRELNSRFAEWFFIVSDDLFNRIHLGRNDLIVAQTGYSIQDFRMLEYQGLQK